MTGHESLIGARCTGFGDCACDACDPPQEEFPLADHGEPLGLFRTLWIVVRYGVRLYGR